MTAIAHYVWDDFLTGFPLKSRIGVGSGVALVRVADNIREVYMNRASRRQPAIAVDYRSGFIFGGLSIDQPTDAADSLVPMAGSLRVFECILRDAAQIVLQATSGDELSACNITIDDSAHVLAELRTPYDNVTLAVDIDNGEADWSGGDLYNHVAIVLDCRSSTAIMKVYVNGALQGSDSAAIDLAPWTPATFDDGIISMGILNGLIGGGGWCEMMVHDAPLSDAQILRRSFNMRAINAQG